MTFGTEMQPSNGRPEWEERIFAIFNRQEPLEALTDLIDALNPRNDSATLQKTAIALDTNVFLRLGSHAKSADIIDFLNSEYCASLILPGQAIQEFWNNQLQVVNTVSAELKNAFSKLKTQVSKVGPEFADLGSRFEELIDEFNGAYGYIYDENTSRKTQKVLDLLKDKALVPYASRLRFAEIAAHRKQTKTPPGFKDDGDGDFFVWVDFLLGLRQAQAAGKEFSRAVLVTSDQKIDWTRYGMAHPILCSEVRAMVGVPFEIWNIKRLELEVAKLA